MDNQIELQIAKLIWPEIDIETVNIFPLKNGINSLIIKSAYEDETISLNKYAIIINIGYGPKSNTLAFRKTRMQPIASSL